MIEENQAGASLADRTQQEADGRAPGSVYDRRARYFSSDNNFEFAWPAVPARQFLTERDRAFDPEGATGLIALDCSDALETAYPATTPTLLLRYVRVRAGETLTTKYPASGEIYYVLNGKGESENSGDVIAWSARDLFCFPGGVETTHRAGAEDCLLLVGTNEPLLAFENLRPPEAGRTKIEAVHWPADEIDRQFQEVWKRPITDNTTGHAVLFSSAALAPSPDAIPSINVAINTLAAGCDQRPHRHNGVAVTLSIQGAGVHSIVDGERIDWSDGAVQITPPAAMHSHHNCGDRRMECLIFQDEALHYYTRTPGFSFD